MYPTVGLSHTVQQVVRVVLNDERNFIWGKVVQKLCIREHVCWLVNWDFRRKPDSRVDGIEITPKLQDLRTNSTKAFGTRPNAAIVFHHHHFIWCSLWLFMVCSYNVLARPDVYNIYIYIFSFTYTALTILTPTIETPKPPFMTPSKTLKTGRCWHPISSQEFLGNIIMNYI